MLVAGEDVTDQRAAQEHMRHLAYHDPLTGLANRVTGGARDAGARPRPPQRRAPPPSSTSTSTASSWSTTPSATPRATSCCPGRQRLEARIRSTDLVARHGGDEFMLLLADLDGDARDTADRVADDLLAALEQPFTLEGHEWIAASIGIATSRPTAGRWPTCSSAPTPRSTAPSARPRNDPFAASEPAPATGS